MQILCTDDSAAMQGSEHDDICSIQQQQMIRSLFAVCSVTRTRFHLPDHTWCGRMKTEWLDLLFCSSPSGIWTEFTLVNVLTCYVWLKLQTSSVSGYIITGPKLVFKWIKRLWSSLLVQLVSMCDSWKMALGILDPWKNSPLTDAGSNSSCWPAWLSRIWNI